MPDRRLIMSIKIISKLISCLYPIRCLGCNKMLNINSFYRWYCNECRSKFETADKKYDMCERCGRIIEHKGKCVMCNQHKPYYDKGYAVFEYSGAVRECIIKFKFKNKKYYSRYFAEVMAEYIKNTTKSEYNYDYITCVPMHKRKKRLRGYNQTELIARNLSKILNVSYVNSLKKIRNTIQQSTLSSKEREHNIKNAFVCCADVKGRHILLIDDVLTTGHTINECSKILKKAGAETVDFAVAACVNDGV